MKKLLIVGCLGASLMGCANSGQFFAGQKLIVDVAEKAADEQMVVAKFNICNVPTVGAWLRAYGSDPTKADAWRTLCAAPVTQSPSNGK